MSFRDLLNRLKGSSSEPEKSVGIPTPVFDSEAVIDAPSDVVSEDVVSSGVPRPDIPVSTAWTTGLLDEKGTRLFERLGYCPDLSRIDDDDSEIPLIRRKTAKACLAMEREVGGVVSDKVIREFDYPPSTRMKCGRDIGMVLAWCVFAMLLDDVELLERHYLQWLRTVLERFDFPEGNRSITSVYMLLREEVLSRLDSTQGELMEPYLSRVVFVMSHGQVTGGQV